VSTSLGVTGLVYHNNWRPRQDKHPSDRFDSVKARDKKVPESACGFSGNVRLDFLRQPPPFRGTAESTRRGELRSTGSWQPRGPILGCPALATSATDIRCPVLPPKSSEATRDIKSRRHRPLRTVGTYSTGRTKRGGVETLSLLRQKPPEFRFKSERTGSRTAIQGRCPSNCQARRSGEVKIYFVKLKLPPVTDSRGSNA